MLDRAPIQVAVRHAMRLAMGAVLAGATMLAGVIPTAAATGTGAQIITGSTPAGVLSITAPASVALPALVPGNSTAATDFGSLTWTDTLNNATASSVTMDATDLYFAAGAGSYIPFTHFTITVDQAPIAGPLNSGSVTAGPASQVLTGADTTPGTTYSAPITLATGTTLADGTWTQAANKITVGVPANTILSTAFTATIQYTVTG
jgi:hypothetical protein